MNEMQNDTFIYIIIVSVNRDDDFSVANNRCCCYDQQIPVALEGIFLMVADVVDVGCCCYMERDIKMNNRLLMTAVTDVITC